MKGSKLPLYALFALVAIALIYRISNPPAPTLPGPLGQFPTWKSIAVRGKMTAQAVNQAGTMWAGAWTDTADNKEQSAIRIVDFNGFSAKSYALPEGSQVESMSWADDGTIRACCSNSKGKGPGVVYVNAATGKLKSSSYFGINLTQVLCWPNNSSTFITALSDKGDGAVLKTLGSQVILAAASDARASNGEIGKKIGKDVTFDLPKDASMASGAGVAADGSSFVFEVSDPAANDGKSFYLGDTKTGTAKNVFDLADVPGKVEGMWASAAGVLMVCRVRGKRGDKLQNALYDTASGKVKEQSGGVDISKWPGAPKSIAFMTFDGGYEFDLATGKTKTLIDMRKKTSADEKGWRDFLRDSRLYKLKNGDYVSISETAGLIDIREIKKDGTNGRAMISRT